MLNDDIDIQFDINNQVHCYQSMQTKSKTLGQLWMKKNEQQDPTLGQVINGIKDYHISRMAEVAKETLYRWDSFVTIQKNYE